MLSAIPRILHAGNFIPALPTRRLYIFDIDGTLLDASHRLHWLSDETLKVDERYDRFFDDCDLDTPILPLINILRALMVDSDIWFFTGRREDCRNKTVASLAQFTGMAPDIINLQLTMRRVGDKRPDYVVKEEMLNNMLHFDRDRLQCVFEDRARVVEMWRSHGIQCLQVQEGNY